MLCPGDPRFQNGVPGQGSPFHHVRFLRKIQFHEESGGFGSIINFTDELPPYDPGFSATSLYDFSQYDVRGRQFRIGVNYKFK